MQELQGRALYPSALLFAFIVSCSGAEELSKACIPTIDCSAIHSIKTPANCSTCLACEDHWGSCTPPGFACKRGSLDLDPNAPGCESQTSDAQGQWVMHSIGESLSYFSFNDTLFVVPMSISVLAYGEDDPSCVPTFAMSCSYTVRALQLEISDFEIPESSWSGGVATLNGPIAAVDDGPGASVIAPMLFAFDVQQEATHRVALDAATANLGVSPPESQRASVFLNVDSIDFGGYKITGLVFNGEVGLP